MNTPDLATGVLRGVSRSFYLSLRWLPAGLREPVSLGYLLARASDTLADTEAVPLATRQRLLQDFRQLAANGNRGRLDAFRQQVERDFLPHQTDPAECRLLARVADCLHALDALPPEWATPLREVVATITGGQSLDLERFGASSAATPRAIASDAELDDYAWRVAGCVGVFWTRAAALACGPRFCKLPLPQMELLGAAYGKGLQLVNILRDLPADLRAGRCYLPVKDPSDHAALAAAWRRWHRRARRQLADGLRYAAAVHGWRLRVASALPALLGEETLDLLERGRCPPPRRVKVGRCRVWQSLARAMLLPGPGRAAPAGGM